MTQITPQAKAEEGKGQGTKIMRKGKEECIPENNKEETR